MQQRSKQRKNWAVALTPTGNARPLEYEDIENDVDYIGDSQSAKAMRLLAQRGLVRPSEFAAEGIHHETVSRLKSQEKLVRSERGIYRLPHWGWHQCYELAIVAKRVPRGVICLESALMFHGLTVQLPPEIWVAIGRHERAPKKFEYPHVQFVRFGPKVFDQGIEVHMIDGVPVNIYCPAKTVVDCFRLLRHVGYAVAIEGLRKSWESGKAIPADIGRFADAAGIGSLITPYIMTATTYDS